MALLLIIDTCLETAYVALAHNETIVQAQTNTVQNEHAAFLHIAVKEILQATGYSFKDIDAVAVTAGPGSYTGIRVGVSAAKGFCFAAGKPLIFLNTLQVLAAAGFDSVKQLESIESACFTVMKARFTEVYAAVYNSELTALIQPEILFINDVSNYLKKQNLPQNLIISGNIHLELDFIQQKFNMYEGPFVYLINNLIKTAFSEYKSQHFITNQQDLLFYLKPAYIK